MSFSVFLLKPSFGGFCLINFDNQNWQYKYHTGQMSFWKNLFSIQLCARFKKDSCGMT